MNLFDTLENKRKTINLSENKKIKIYVCGITPYSESHIGHAMSAVIFDTLRKYLLANNQNVTYVQNFTDIDDKLINAAEEIPNHFNPELKSSFASAFANFWTILSSNSKPLLLCCPNTIAMKIISDVILLSIF